MSDTADLMMADRRIPAGDDWLPQDFLGRLTPEGLTERTRALKPLIAANAQRAEQLRRPVDEVWQALRAAGIFYHFVPKRFGGLGFGVEAFIDAMLPVAEACGSTGWTATFCVEHNWMLSQFPEEGQEEIFSRFPYIVAPAALVPPGKAVEVEGGYRLDGRWKWGTGVMHADWILLAAVVEGGSAPQMIMVAIPANEVAVIDVWHVAGMAGTGSNDILVEDVFVPALRAVDIGRMCDGSAHGATLYDDPVYAMPMFPFLCVAASIPALGIARGAVERFRDAITHRFVRGTETRQMEKSLSQVRLSRVTVMVETAELIIRDIARHTMAIAGQGADHVDERIHMRAQASYAVKLCSEAIGVILEASGSSVHSLDHPLQRAMRDMAVIAGHAAFDLDLVLEADGRTILGLPHGLPIY